MRHTATVLLLTCSATCSLQAREWMDVTGKHSVEAELVRIDGDEALLKKHDGSEVQIPLRKLRFEDHCWAVEHEQGKRYADYLRTIEERKRAKVDEISLAIEELKKGQKELRAITRSPTSQIRRLQNGETDPPWELPKGVASPSELPEWPGRRKTGAREMIASIRDWAKRMSAEIPTILEQEEARLAATKEGTCHTVLVPAGPGRVQTGGARFIEEGSQDFYVAMDRWARMPPAHSSNLSVGLIGHFWTGAAYRILQVVGPDELHVELSHQDFSPMRFAVRGLPTGGLAEQRGIALSGLFEVTGTQTYATVTGGSKTIFVVEPIRIPGLE